MDECHYASGNHPYMHLMTKFYHTLPKKDRPHILGLTASPLLNVKETHSDDQISSLLENLEETLDATLVSASGQTSSDDSINVSSAWLSRTIHEEVIEYNSTNKGRGIPSASNLALLPARLRELKQLEYLYRDVGPLVLQVYCGVLRLELSRNHFESESNKQFDAALEYLNRLDEFCEHEIRSLPAMVRKKLACGVRRSCTIVCR